MATLPVSALSGLDLPAVGSWVLTFVGVNLAAALAAASWPGGSPFKDTIGRLQCAQRAASTIHSSLGVATWLRVVLSDWGSLTDAEGHFVPLAVMGDQVSLELGYYLVDTAVDAVKWSLEGRVNWGDAVHHGGLRRVEVCFACAARGVRACVLGRGLAPARPAAHCIRKLRAGSPE